MKGQTPGAILKPLVKLGRAADDCWTWLGAIDAAGYGRKEYLSRTWLAHRWLWVQMFGQIPEGLVIGHKCENRACVNPHHLHVVTQAANVRHGIGTSLTPNDVLEIKRARANRTFETPKILAERYGVSPSTISDIWGGKSWGRAKPFFGATANNKRKVAT